jgi:hypothetical protein
MSGNSKQNNKGIVMGTFVWVAGVIGGGAMVMRHEFTPGPSAKAAAWRGDSSLQLAKDRPTLVMFIHPRCPCSGASLEELNRIMTHCRDRMSVNVVFFTPTQSPEQWVNQSSWKQAASIPGVHTVRDDDGAIARRFGAVTSGQVLLFDQRGRLSFSGGITGSRGHSGDNAGARAIVELVRGTINTPREPLSTPVFGCAIVQTGEQP